MPWLSCRAMSPVCIFSATLWQPEAQKGAGSKFSELTNQAGG